MTQFYNETFIIFIMKIFTHKINNFVDIYVE